MQEVSRGHSIPILHREKDQTLRKPILDPNYICGFVDGEGCFSISISKHQTLKRKVEVRALFEIELRADDIQILKQIQKTLDCGKIYNLDYSRYGWQPHIKYKVSNIKDLSEKIIPFFDRYQLRAKKRYTYKIFKQIVLMIRNKEHLNNIGYNKILHLRQKIKAINRNIS